MGMPIRTLISRVWRHALLLALLPACAAAQDAARMESLLQARVADKSFMGAALVARGDEVVLNKGYGFANLEWNIPNTPDTKFRLGSVTKQFTAAAILLLAEQGGLALDDTVGKHWPEAPGAWQAITIEQLLRHTSGIPNFTDYPEYAQEWKFHPSTPAQSLARLRDKPLDFTPGSRMSYSNSGYLMLGLIIERVSGQSYAAFLQARIFTPLGMNETGYDENAEVLPRRAAGYSPGPGGIVNAAYVDMSVPHGAGALYSTTGDLLRWTRGLFEGRLLSASLLEKMTTAGMGNYGMGVGISNTGRRSISHNGGIEGFNTQLTYYPESRITVAVLANLNGAAAGQLAGQLGALAHGDAVRSNADRTSISLPREKLERLVGSYELAPTATMRIWLDGGQLQSQLGGQPVVPLFAESETLFFPRAVEAQLEFTIGTDGRAGAVTLRQNGQEIRAPRIADRTEIQLLPAVLERYTGTYQLRPGFDLVITLENGQLMSQATGQGKAPLFAESANRFFLKVANAQIEFISNGEQVTALVLHQGGRETRAARQ